MSPPSTTLSASTAPDVGVARRARAGFVDRWLRRRVLAPLPAHRGVPFDVVLPEGTRLRAGPDARGPVPALFVRDDAFFRRVALRGRLGLGEAYEAGLWDADDLEGVLAAGLTGGAVRRRPVLDAAAALLAPRRRRNDRAGARRNIEAHYDLGNDFYALWLDPSMCYSSAMFAAPDEDLEAAQRRKLDVMADKAGIRAGDRVLEVGCGWGAFAVRAALEREARVTALTLSPSQHAAARERAAQAGVADRVDMRLLDWRDASGVYDAVVSIEMLEAVGRRDWAAWFQALDARLAPHGRAAVQVICHPDQGFSRYAARTDWIERYVFPGSLLGSLAEFTRILGRETTLRVVDVEDLAPSYAITLRRWLAAFRAQTPALRALGLAEPFLRRWTYYLAVCAAAFATGHLLNLQLVLARPGSRRALRPAAPAGAPA